MYTHAIAIYFYPEACTGGRSIPGQRRFAFAFRLYSREHAPIGFCCGGFSSTAAYDSGKRGSTFIERLRCFRADQVLEAPPVFIRALRKSFDFPSKPFGFGMGRE